MYSFKEVAIYVGLGLQNVLPFDGSLMMETMLVELGLFVVSRSVSPHCKTAKEMSWTAIQQVLKY